MTTEAITGATAFIVNARYRVNRDHPQGSRLSTGDTVQARTLNGSVWHVSRITEHDTPEDRIWAIYASDVDALHSEPDSRVAELERALSEANALLASERQTNRSFRERVAADTVVLNEEFGEAADSNDLCGVYDTTVQRANSRMSVIHIDEREVDFDVTWQETYTVTVTRSSSFTGVRNDDDGNRERADEIANEADTLEEWELIDLLRENGSHEFVDDSTDNVDYNQS